MKPLRELKKDKRLHFIKQNEMFLAAGYHVYDAVIDTPEFFGTVLFGYDEAGIMEHVSVNPAHRPYRYEEDEELQTPTWEMMCMVKDMFFYPDEDAIQYHPKQNGYFHGFSITQHCLHLWRPMKGDWKVLNNSERWD